ncbi:hypothetical protein L3X38_001225 [Prunus dulcis]|uniref:Uncharacterized protein n=1 Tax=Prunus dulcis TaxID=3755 RepID=A0AAD4ZK46_PRUDU|nr:hypothetical protein L3X38_001225 [Prunus dulcis]
MKKIEVHPKIIGNGGSNPTPYKILLGFLTFDAVARFLNLYFWAYPRTIRLSDDNYLKWSYQLESVLQGYDLFGYLDGSVLAYFLSSSSIFIFFLTASILLPSASIFFLILLTDQQCNISLKQDTLLGAGCNTSFPVNINDMSTEIQPQPFPGNENEGNDHLNSNHFQQPPVVSPVDHDSNVPYNISVDRILLCSASPMNVLQHVHLQLREQHEECPCSCEN